MGRLDKATVSQGAIFPLDKPHRKMANAHTHLNSNSIFFNLQGQVFEKIKRCILFFKDFTLNPKKQNWKNEDVFI